MKELKSIDQLKVGDYFTYFCNGKEHDYLVVGFDSEYPEIMYARDVNFYGVPNAETFNINEYIRFGHKSCKIYIGEYEHDFIVKKKIEYHQNRIESLKKVLDDKKK